MTRELLTLVVLAAGLGRRFGGLKQLAPVGSAGATLMDYSIYDALRAGFSRIVFVIRPEIEDALHRWCQPRFAERVPVAFALQRLDDLPGGVPLPAGRSKPWGTGQAVLSAAKAVSGPFGVVNADDFYGASAFRRLAEFLRSADQATASVPEYALVGYPLRATLPKEGAVNRALCRCDAQGRLVDIEEIQGLGWRGNRIVYHDAQGNQHAVAPEHPVSMNLWGFTPKVFGQLQAEFRRFLETCTRPEEEEFHLPSGVRSLIRSGQARVRVLPGPETWCGVTHAQDRAAVAAMIDRLVAQGEYPAELWS